MYKKCNCFNYYTSVWCWSNGNVIAPSPREHSAGLHTDINFLPDCVMGTHGKHGLKAHCSAKHKIRENSISACPEIFFFK